MSKYKLNEVTNDFKIESDDVSSIGLVHKGNGNFVIPVIEDTSAPTLITESLDKSYSLGTEIDDTIQLTLENPPENVTYEGDLSDIGLNVSPEGKITGTINVIGTFNKELKILSNGEDAGTITLNIEVKKPTVDGLNQRDINKKITDKIDVNVSDGIIITPTIKSGVTYEVTGLDGTGLSFKNNKITGTSTKLNVEADVKIMYSDIELGSYKIVFKFTPVTNVTTQLITGLVGSEVNYDLTSNISVIPSVTDGVTHEVTGIPAGLTAEGLVISGTPTSAGTGKIVVTTKYENKVIGTSNFNFEVYSVTANGTITGTVSEAVNYNVRSLIEPTNKNTVPVLSLSEESSIPEGLTFDASTGVISGTVANAVDSNVKINYSINSKINGTIDLKVTIS